MLEPNQIFAGRFRIIKHLANGGMGVMFEAVQLSTRARVALELPWPNVTRSARARQRFEGQAKLAERVNSEHIACVRDAGFDSATGWAYLVLEPLVGCTLGANVKNHGAISPAVTLALMRQLARALDAAHVARCPAGEPIAHRCLSPRSLFLCARAEGEPLLKVLDFGMARVVREVASVSRDVRGAPAYMAYEQVAGAAGSPRTDIWAFGLIAYYALTGRAYWPAANLPAPRARKLLKEIQTLPLPRASQRVREDGLKVSLPRAFDAWLFGCIARDASQRFACAGDAMDALECVLREPPSPQPGAALQKAPETQRFAELARASDPASRDRAGAPPTLPGTASERRRIRRRRPLRVVSSLSLALVLLAMAWHFMDPPGAGPAFATSPPERALPAPSARPPSSSLGAAAKARGSAALPLAAGSPHRADAGVVDGGGLDGGALDGGGAAVAPTPSGDAANVVEAPGAPSPRAADLPEPPPNEPPAKSSRAAPLLAPPTPASSPSPAPTEASPRSPEPSPEACAFDPYTGRCSPHP